MKQIIQHKLAEIEKDYNIRILFSCESGSRAWGFPSPDSDYDIRFIYIHTAKTYLSIKGRKEHLSFPINDELDIYGWDLRKVLKLIAASNTTPFEWLQSPIIYKEQPGFRDSLWNICRNYFYKRKNIHHYLGIATGALETLNDSNEIKIKKLFYVLRPLLAAQWCMDCDSIAPMAIEPLLKVAPEMIAAEIIALIKQKETAAEGFMIPLSDTLKKWIEDTFKQCSLYSDGLKKGNDFDLTQLDDFFLKMIAYDHKGS